MIHIDDLMFVQWRKTNKNDLSTDEVEFMRQPHEYTFHPNKDKPSGRDYDTMRTDSSSPKGRKRRSPKRGGPSPDNEQFQINVNIGGTRKTIIASMKSDPSATASKFMKQNNLDDKFHKTLTDLISD